MITDPVTLMGIIAGVATILSFALEIYQVRKRKAETENRSIIRGSSAILKTALRMFVDAHDEILVWARVACLGRFSYSKMMDKSLEAFRKARANGVKIRILLDIYNLEGARCAKQFLETGAEVRHTTQVPAFFVAVDRTILLDTTTKIEVRGKRLIGDTGEVISNAEDIENLTRDFDRTWEGAMHAEKLIEELGSTSQE